MLTMNGTVIPGTPIAVDFWKIRECPTAKLFFLTHLHGDHTVGLSSSWRHVIYCSPMTGELLSHLYGIGESLIQPLEVGTSHIIDLDNVDSEKMSVTLIDANHCPGSVMFLFEGYFGRILHTGDFRFCEDMIDESNKTLFKDIDILYLDNTYCSPQCVFPSRESALDEIVSVINSHPNHSVVIGMRNLGKEDMLAKTALKCKEWISVPAKMMQRINFLKLPNVFVTDDESCRLRVARFQTVSKKNMALWNKVTPTIAILPTALYQGMDFNSFGNMANVFIVQYSDHSSYQELYNFVSVVKPRKIIPVVGAKARGPFGVDISDRANMNCFSHLLDKSETLSKMSDIPESVKKLMHNGSSYHGNGGGGKLTKPWKFKYKKSSMSLTRGVVFSGNDDQEECERTEDHESCEKSSHDHTVINIRDISVKKRKRNFSEILDSNINSQSQMLQAEKTKQENCRPQVKESLLDKWLSVRDVRKTDRSPHHKQNRPLLFKTSSRNCFLSKTESTGKSKLKSESLDFLEAANDTKVDTFIPEMTQSADVEDVIIIDDTSSDGTYSSQSTRRGDNSTMDSLNCVDDSVTKEQDSLKYQESNSSCEGDCDLSVRANGNLSDKTHKVNSHCLHFPEVHLSCKSTRSLNVTQTKGQVQIPDPKCEHVYSCKPKPHVVKCSRQISESEQKPEVKFSVKPSVFGRKTISQRQSSTSRENIRSLFSVKPLDQGK